MQNIESSMNLLIVYEVETLPTVYNLFITELGVKEIVSVDNMQEPITISVNDVV
jgi:hypothetical protein